MTDNPGYDLVMPFVTVASKGGPHDDDAYTAGWEMGALDAFLSAARPVAHKQMIHAVNAEQADLIAMKNGYKACVRSDDDDPDWSWLELQRSERP